MSEEGKNNKALDDAAARAIYDVVRRKQVATNESTQRESRRPKPAVKLQYIGFRKRLAIFALSMTALMGFYMMSFIFEFQPGHDFGVAMDEITLGVVNFLASLVPDGVSLSQPVKNVLSFTPLGVVFGTCLVSIVVTAAAAFCYSVIVTSHEKDKHDSRFLME